jgi:hypothetical protein
VSPKVAAHPMKLEHQVQAKDKQYDDEIIMMEHDRPPQEPFSQHCYWTFTFMLPE